MALPLLAAATACSPVREYEQAARALTFRLERVDPQLRLALPLDRSAVTFRLVVAVENPSGVAFHLLGFAGDMILDTGGASFTLGKVELVRPLDLAPASTGRMEADVTFTYGDLRDNWARIESAGRGAPGSWRLQGSLKAEVHGIPLTLPLKAQRSFGGPA
jgi:hypothetical protein